MSLCGPTEHLNERISELKYERDSVIDDFNQLVDKYQQSLNDDNKTFTHIWRTQHSVNQVIICESVQSVFRGKLTHTDGYTKNSEKMTTFTIF